MIDDANQLFGQHLKSLVVLSLFSLLWTHASVSQDIQDHASELESSVQPVREFNPAFSDEKINKLKQAFPLFTGVPAQYEKIVFIAISHFPELKKVPIKFVLAKTKWPLTAQPFFTDTVNPFRKRRYRIIISEESSDGLNDVLLKSLPFNAQIGAIGHELAHIADYQKKSGVELAALGISYWAGYNRMEVEHSADKTAIDHGLGHQLYFWSSYVRTVMGDNDWVIPNKEFKETYTSPKKILAMIEGSPLYQRYVQVDNCQKSKALC